MPQSPLLPKNFVLPEIIGDFPCVVFYVDVAQDKVLEYRWSKLSEVVPTIAVIQENEMEQKAGCDGKK